MLGLPELQAGFARAMLQSDDAALLDEIAEDGLSPTRRLDIYRNTVLVSLTDVLLEAFPVVSRLVDERFFRYAASAFIGAYPPAQACLSAYGDNFADFLAGFPPCRSLVYLSDVARLEWLMHRAAFADESVPLSPAALVDVADPGRLRLRFDPSLGLLGSPWPIDRIWRANGPGAGGEGIDLACAGVCLEVRRITDDVMLRNLDAASFCFRGALWSGGTLADAAETALQLDVGFDVTSAIADLFREGCVVAVVRDGAGN